MAVRDIVRPIVRDITRAIVGVLDSGFNPASLFAAGEQGVFYDSSDLSKMWQDSAGTVPAAVNSPVGKWEDKSGRGNHQLQATTAAKPTLRLASGKYYLEFDAVDDQMATAAAIGITAPSFQLVHGSSTVGVTGFAAVLQNGRYFWGRNAALAHFVTVALLGYDSAAGFYVANTPTVASILFDGGFDATFRKNGAANATALGAANGANSETVLNLGHAAGVSFWDGRIYQVVLLGRAMTTAEQTDTETFVNTKTGAY